MSDVFAGHRALVEAGRFEDAMRMSGEALAAADAALGAAAKAPEEERKARALRFMEVAELQLADLHYAGMYEAEAATALMVPATIIIARVNPESIAQPYVQWLQGAAGRFGDAVQHCGDERLVPDFERLLKLAVVTCDDYAVRFGLDAATMRVNEALKNFLESANPDIDYEGAPIRPQTAIDILLNAINTMASTGHCE